MKCVVFECLVSTLGSVTLLCMVEEVTIGDSWSQNFSIVWKVFLLPLFLYSTFLTCPSTSTLNMNENYHSTHCPSPGLASLYDQVSSTVT